MTSRRLSIASGRANRGIVGLDLVRFAAASMVMGFHFGFWQWAAPQTRTNRLLALDLPMPAFGRIAVNGWVGVEIFFVISGFVIAWSAEKASFGGFLRARFLRLAPAAWICGSISALALLASRSASPPELLRPYVRTLTFFPTAPWIDDAYWTLDIEVAFYALVALLIALGRRSWLTAVVGGVGAASATFWIAFSAIGGSGLAAAANSRYGELALLHHGCFFCIGVLFLRAMESRRIGGAIFGLGALCLAGGVVEIIDSAAAKTQATGIAVGAAIPIAIWLLALAAIAGSIAANSRLAGLAMLARSRSIGLATYPLYLLHAVTGGVAMKAASALGVPGPAALIVGVVVALTLALLVSEMLEPWTRRAVAAALDAGKRRPTSAKLGGDLA